MIINLFKFVFLLESFLISYIFLDIVHFSCLFLSLFFPYFSFIHLYPHLIIFFFFVELLLLFFSNYESDSFLIDSKTGFFSDIYI